MKKQPNNPSPNFKAIMAVLTIFLLGSPVCSFQIATVAKGVKTASSKTVTEK